MKNVVQKMKAIGIVLLLLFIGDVVLLGIFPKLVAKTALLFGAVLDCNDLFTNYLMGIGVRLLGCILFCIIMKKMNIMKTFRYRLSKKDIALSWMFFVYIIFNIEYAGLNGTQWYVVVALIITSLFIGLFEESLFRGIILNLLLKQFGEDRKGTLISIWISSGIFGLFHLTNLFSGDSLLSVLTQVIYATIFGVAFSALYIRTNKNLLWCAIIHFLYDLAYGFGDLAISSDFSTEAADSPQIGGYLLNLLLFMPILVYSLFLLRKSRFPCSVSPDTVANDASAICT